MEVRSRRREWGGRKGGSLPGGDIPHPPPRRPNQRSKFSHLISWENTVKDLERYSLGQFVVLF